MIIQNIIKDKTKVALYRDKVFVKAEHQIKSYTPIKSIHFNQLKLRNDQLHTLLGGIGLKYESCLLHKHVILGGIEKRSLDNKIALDEVIKSFGGMKGLKYRAKKSAKGEFVIVFDYPETKIEIESFITKAKSLLDSLAQMISITFHLNKTSFNSKFVTAIENKAKENKTANKIYKLIKLNQPDWIDELINIRNLSIHHGGIFNQFNYAIDLVDIPRRSLSLIQKPIMPNNELVTPYILRVMKRILHLKFWLTYFCTKEIRINKSNHYSQGNLKCHCSSGQTYADCHGKNDI